MKIGKHDTDEQVFVVAELSANHNGSLDTAIKSLEAIKRTGANAVKLQTYKPESLTINLRKKDFILRNGTIWDGQSLWELYSKAAMPYEWHETLFKKAKDLGLICFSTPFCTQDLEFLSKFDPVAYKIASFEAIDFGFVKEVLKKDKPVLVSTGITNFSEIRVLSDLMPGFKKNIAFLHCVSSYPTKEENANLSVIQDLKKTMPQHTIGYSDHTQSTQAAPFAVAAGARIIEKHFVLDKSLDTADASFSLDEQEFTTMVQEIRRAELLQGKVEYGTNQAARNLGRSIYVIKPIKKGEVFTTENIRAIRPGFSIHPKHLDKLLGKKSNKDFTIGSRISLAHIEQGF